MQIDSCSSKQAGLQQDLLIKCLAKLGPVLDKSILAGKTDLTFAILEALAKYGSFG